MERKAVLRKRDLQVILCAVFRLVELKTRRVQAYAAVFDRAVLFDDQLAAALIPCRRDGGREHRRTAGKGEFRAVFALIVAADQRNGFSVLLFQRLQRGIVCHILHRHAAVYGERGKPLGRNGSIHRIRLGWDILRARLDQIMKAPKEVGVPLRAAGFFECEAGIAVTLHPGIQRLIARHYADSLRQGDTNRLAADGGDIFFIVIRQPHKGICPRVAVRIDFGDVNAVLIVPHGIPLGNGFCAQILHGRGECRAFGGDLRVLPLRHGGTAHFNGRTARLFQCGDMSRGGKAVERIPPFKREVTNLLGHTVFVDMNFTDRRQYTPCVGRCPVFLELDKLIVNRRLCLNMAMGGQQRILHLDGIRAAVRRFGHKFRFYRLRHHALFLSPALDIGGKGAARRLPDQYAFLIGLCRGRNREVGITSPQFAIRHMDVLVLQGKRAIVQCDGFHRSFGRKNVPRKSQRLHGQCAKQQA